MTLGGAAQVVAAHCQNERTLDPAVCSYNRPTHHFRDCVPTQSNVLALTESTTEE